MEQTFEVTITSDPEEGVASPTEEDVVAAVKAGLEEVGIDTLGLEIEAKQL